MDSPNEIRPGKRGYCPQYSMSRHSVGLSSRWKGSVASAALPRQLTEFGYSMPSAAPCPRCAPPAARVAARTIPPETETVLPAATL